MRWVRQEDAYGCGIASCAMLIGCTYAEAKAWFLAQEGELAAGAAPRGEDFFQRSGICHYDVEDFLGAHGYAVVRRFRYSRGCVRLEWPPAPFGPAHHCEVVAPSGYGHSVVMLADGTVLDPNDPRPKRLTDWGQVNNVAAVFPVRVEVTHVRP
jgi:hypothetical protein